MGGGQLLLLASILFCAVYCPFTKVEESFNIQAIHDFLNIGIQSIELFDHLDFPGVVPRTFLGAFFISVLTTPLSTLASFLATDQRNIQVIARCVLGGVCWISFLQFTDGVRKKFGHRVAQLTELITALQFHLCFYMSRTLPNTFALIFCLTAFGYWLKGSAYKAITIIAVAMVIFRCDMLILLAPLVLQLLVAGEITFVRGALLGIVVCAAALGLTVAFDSYMWRRWVWPEGVVLLFNSVENRSSEWGVMPAHWYLTNALAKAVNVSLVWLVCGVAGLRYRPLSGSPPGENDDSQGKHRRSLLCFSYGFDSTVAYYVLPAVLFVALYSILPHKELRFIFSAIPLLTMGAAVGLDGILPADSSALLYPLGLLHSTATPDATDQSTRNRKGSKRWIPPLIISCAVLAGLTAQLALFSVCLTASHHNYPGGAALGSLVDRHLRDHLEARRADFTAALPSVFATDEQYRADQLTQLAERALQPIFVHITTAAAMTGVSRFGQMPLNLMGQLPDQLQKHRVNHFNVNPVAFDHAAHASLVRSSCLWEHLSAADSDSLQKRLEQCSASINLVYYSKDEHALDFSNFHWLISERTDSGGEHFVTVEGIRGFHRMRYSFSGAPKAELTTQLHILYNTFPNH